MKSLRDIPPPFLLLLPLSILGFSLVNSWLNRPEEAAPPGPAGVPVEETIYATPVEEAPAPREPSAPKPPTTEDGAHLFGEVVAPEVVNLGDPIEVSLKATNHGTVPLRDVLLWLPLPEDTHTTGGARYLRFTTKQLAPGESFERGGTIIALMPGNLTLNARFSSAQTGETVTSAKVRLPTAVLEIVESVPESLPAGERTSLCFEVSNLGDAPARDVWVRLRDQTTAPIGWRSLAPGETRTACFSMRTPSPGDWQLEAEASAFAADVATTELTVPVE